MTSGVQGERRAGARSSYAEPQPSLAMHLQMHCKGTKKRDANQAFRCFISDLFQMLKWRTKQEQSQANLLAWTMPCKEEFDEVNFKESGEADTLSLYPKGIQPMAGLR